MDLLLTAGDDAHVEQALLRSCHAHRLPASMELLERLYDRLPAGVRHRGLGELLAGMTTAAHDLPAGIARIERALARCRQEGNEAGVMLAVEHLSIFYNWMEDAERLRDLWRRLADVLPAGQEMLTVLADALIADTEGDPHRVLAALRTLDGTQVPRYWTVPIAWLRATALLALGFPEAALRHVEVAVERTGTLLQGAMSMRLVDALFLAGERDRAFEVLDRMIRHRVDVGNAHTCCLGHCQAATLHALTGQLDVARTHVQRASLYAGPEPNPPAAAAVSAARAVVALAAGDEDEAARLLHEHRRDQGIGDGRQRYGQLRRLAVHYVLDPQTRAYWDGADVGPSYALARDLGRALTALRDAGDVAPAAQLGPDHWSAAPAFLPLGWQAELAVAAAAGGSAGGQTVALELSAAARPALRRLGESPSAPRQVRRWALTLLDVPAIPEASVEIDVLGPARLRRDGRPVDHPHWRRQRVRALLLFLVARQGGTREEIAASLWPDLAPAAAARNLRVTLSYLLALLEPDRADGEPSCFVRSEATSVRLVNHEWLSVDVWEMERLLDQAEIAERGGEPSVALHHLRRAVAFYRGPYLADVGYETWALPHRDRLAARFVAAAVHAGELTLATGEADEALRLASRALEEEPYSEPAHRLAIAAHLARGDVAAAHRALTACKRRLDELDLEPSEDLQILERSLTDRR
jgi:LuxR family maltose regulon positive regulatory protein